MLQNLLLTFLAFQFKPMNFVYNLKYMGIGMVCIIIVMGVLILMSSLLNNLATKLDSKKKDKDNK
jgi:1,4-dihydroxy-2-naphthoate octaprenyltransferase